MWFKSSFTFPAVAAIGFCLIGGTSPAAADKLHLPGDFPTIQFVQEKRRCEARK